MPLRRKFFIFALLAMTSLVGILGALYFAKMTTDNGSKNLLITVIINYNFLKEEHNEDNYTLSLPDGSTAFDAFSAVANLTVVTYPFGVYIKGVNGYMEHLPYHYWAFYYYDHSSHNWVYSEVGVSNYYLRNDDYVKLQYI